MPVEAKEKEEKTSEQIETERLDRYIKNPDSFVELSELACAVLLTPGQGLGVAVMIGKIPRIVLNVDQVELNHALNGVRIAMDQAKQQIVKPKGSILDFARRKK